jgi:hypothetical protein
MRKKEKTIKFDRKFIRIIQSKLSKQEVLTNDQVVLLCQELFELDELFERIYGLMRVDMIKATNANDYSKLLSSLIMLDIRLWEVLDQHIPSTRRILRKVTTRTSNFVESQKETEK